jgi:hypothetical protein
MCQGAMQVRRLLAVDRPIWLILVGLGFSCQFLGGTTGRLVFGTDRKMRWFMIGLHYCVSFEN